MDQHEHHQYTVHSYSDMILILLLFFRLGDLLCCETCSAVYHLACVEPPMEEVPEEDWVCTICKAHKVGKPDPIVLQEAHL